MANVEKSNKATMAAAMHAICVGQDAADCLWALATVIGAIEATARRPDLDGLMEILTQIAESSFNSFRQERGVSHASH